MPRVTWLLPVLDAMPFLPEALESIAAQTFRDHEVLAWDNGSRDGSRELLEAWIPARLPGRVVVDRPRAALGGCLRDMVAEAHGELLARMDGDDVSEPERLARQVAALDAHPEWLGLGSQLRRIDAGGRPLEARRDFPCDPPELRWRLFFHTPLGHPTVCLRRDAVLRAGSYADLGVGQDWDLWFRMLLRGPMGNLPTALLRYRQHEGSVASRSGTEWPELGRRLAERYAPELFPGVAPEAALAVWRYFSPRSPERGAGPAPSPRRICELARAGARAAGWDDDTLLRLPVVQGWMRRCVRRRPRWIGDWLAVQSALWLRARPRAAATF